MLQRVFRPRTRADALAVSYQVIGAAIEVHRILGPGLLESVYEAALAQELSLRNIRCLRQVQVPLIYKGHSLGSRLKLDLLVEEMLLVEVKSVESILPVHKAQLLSYLRLGDLWIGPLINFNEVLLRDGIRRILNG